MSIIFIHLEPSPKRLSMLYTHPLKVAHHSRSENLIPNNFPIPPMKRIPNASNTLIQTPHNPPTLHALHLLPIRIFQQLRLLQYLLFLQIPHTDDFFPSVDVLSSYDRMVIASWGDVDLDLGVGAGEGGEKGGFEELAGG